MNKVTVLTAGYVQAIAGRQLIPGAADDGARRVASTVTLIQGDHAIVVADPGMVTGRGLILGPLNKAVVSPQDVTHIFISHHHPDHTVNITVFPNAEIVDFWGLYKGDLWRDHGDGYEITPGVKVLRTPGPYRGGCLAAGGDRRGPLCPDSTPQPRRSTAPRQTSEHGRMRLLFAR